MTKEQYLENHTWIDEVDSEEEPRCDYKDHDIMDDEYVYVFRDGLGDLWCICEQCAIKSVSGAEMIFFMESNDYIGKMRYPDYVDMKGNY